MRVLIAGRLSQGNGEESDRISRDDDSAREWAEREGHQVIGTSRDYVSGKSDPFTRKELGVWLTNRSDEWDILVCSKLDRLGRNARNINALKAWVEDNGKQLLVLDGMGVPLQWPVQDGAAGSLSKLMWDITSWFAEEELRGITEKQANARKEVRKNHGFVGRLPFGFKVAVGSDRYSRQLVPVPELEPIIREMVRRGIRGDTFTDIAAWMDTQVDCKHLGKKIKGATVTGWTDKSVKGVLTSTSLKGQYIYTNEGVKVTHWHEGIITEDVWNQLQEKCQRGFKDRGKTAPALLIGTIYCTRCGGKMYRHQSNVKRKDGTINVHEYYRCSGGSGKASKCKLMVNLEEMNEAVSEHLLSAHGDKQVFERVTVPGSDHSVEIAEIEENLRTLDFDSPDYATRHAALLAQRTQLLEMPATPATVTEVPSGQTVADVWAGLDTAARRRFLMAANFKVLVTGKDECAMVGVPDRLSAALRTIAA